MRIMKLAVLGFLTTVLLAIGNLALAVPSLGGVADKGTTAIGNLAHLMMSGAFMIAFGFGIATLVQYKAHRDNPSQVPLSKPITMLFMALAFTALAVIFLLYNNSIIGNGELTAGPAGITSFQ